MLHWYVLVLRDHIEGTAVGFFKKIFGRDWASFKQRGDKYLAKNDWGRARGEYQEAIKRLKERSDSDSDSALTDIQNKLVQANLELYQLNIEKARSLEKSALFSQAIEQYHLALEFANKEERQESIAKIAEIEERENTEASTHSKKNQPKLHAPQEIDRNVKDEKYELFYVYLAALDPVQADVYETFGEGFREGYLALMSGDIETAESLLQPVFEKEPTNIYLQYEIGRIRIAQERYEEAEELLRKACEASPDFLPLRHARIEALWGLKDMEGSERVVEEAFDIDDEVFENYRYAGQTCLLSGEYENGVEILEVGMAIHENSIDLNRLLGQLEQGRGNHQNAIDAFETVLGMMCNTTTRLKS